MSDSTRVRLALLAALLLAGGTVRAAEQRSVSGFDRVMFALPGQLTLQQGDAFVLEIDAAEEDLERVETRVQDNELAIRWREGVRGWAGARDHGPIEVRLTLPALRSLEVAGSGDVDGGSWLGESLEVEVNGSGSVAFGEVTVEELSLEIAGSGSIRAAKVDTALARIDVRGSGDVHLAGAADRQEIEVMGSGDVALAELEGAHVEVEIMGSGDVTVWANETLEAEIMGSGDVSYRGTPKVELEKNGPGRVRTL
ncbi:MAG TPA: head GIN domain-containing protein [Pseudomonadales bacterium]